MSEIHEEHGPDCTCGCHDHGRDHKHHDHGHEHDHEHAHEHAHEHTVELGWAGVTLESHVHDQASTVSATIHAQSDSGKSFEALVGALQTVAQRVESAGAIVGHIKAYARSSESFAHASVTDAQHSPACEGDVDLLLSSDVQSQLVAIVLLINLDELEHIVVEALESL